MNNSYSGGVSGMKILIVNKFLYPNGGSETYIFKLGNYLKQQGHEVQYFGMEHEARIVGNDAGCYTSNMDFHTSRLQKLLYPVKIIYSLESRKKLRVVLNDFQPDVVHINNMNYQLTPSIIYEIKKYNKNCKIIFTAHDYQLVCPNHMMNNPGTKSNCEKCTGGNYIHCIKGKCIHGSTIKSTLGAIEGGIYRTLKTYRYIDKIICPTRFMESKMNLNPCLAGRTIMLHNFIDKVQWKDVAKEDYVLYFGRYSEEKGIKTLIEICKQLPEIKFIFAGSGPLDYEISNISNIKNIGFQKGEELEMVIRKARFSVYPSEWYENCPFSVMESQMYGTPVIGADIGGIPELIEAGKTGELFESGNIDDLKEKISELWNNNEKCNEYISNCRNTRFDIISEYYKKIMMIYQK
jgi:glycosyltransferase involved in cell wall biosynthesis